MSQGLARLIDILESSGALKFGPFTTKAGRLSPYFVNFAAIDRADQLITLGQLYADTLVKEWGRSFDVLFGPAYKGIPLAVTTAIALEQNHQHSVRVAFNRKEAKDHGEGGTLIGKISSSDQVVIIDDVLSRGTSLGESVHLLKRLGCNIHGAVVAIDRQEAGPQGKRSALDEISQHYGLKILCLSNISAITEHMNLDAALKQAIADYRKNSFVQSS